MRKLLLVLALVVSSSMACGDEDKLAATQVTLTIQADNDLRLQLDDLRATLFVNDNGNWSRRSSVDVPAARLKWPLDVPILARPEDESSQIEVIVEAFQKEQRLAQSRVVTRFLKDRVVVVSTNLYVCPGRSACADDSCHGETCAVCSSTGGECISVGITDPNDAGSITPVQDAAPPQDANTAADASTPVDAAADAGPVATVCPPNACAEPYVCITTPVGYTCRGQFADWPMPDNTPGAKVAPNLTATPTIVTDNVTKLQWQNGIPRVYPGCTEYTMTGSTKGDIGELCTRAQGAAYCSNLTNGDNEKNWRLPTVIEMSSLYDLSREDNRFALDGTAFGDSTLAAYVTASTYAGSPGQVWAINYLTRENYFYSNYPGKVRCVRGGAVPSFATPADRYVLNGNEATDQATGLVWQRAVSMQKYTYEANSTGLPLLATACSTDGWRLPSIKELLTLVDYTRSSPAINTTVFPDTPSENFWGVLTNRQNVVNFTSGVVDIYEEQGYVRCVK